MFPHGHLTLTSTFPVPISSPWSSPELSPSSKFPVFSQGMRLSICPWPDLERPCPPTPCQSLAVSELFFKRRALYSSLLILFSDSLIKLRQQILSDPCDLLIHLLPSPRVCPAPLLPFQYLLLKWSKIGFPCCVNFCSCPYIHI